MYFGCKKFEFIKIMGYSGINKYINYIDSVDSIESIKKDINYIKKHLSEIYKYGEMDWFEKNKINYILIKLNKIYPINEVYFNS